MEKTFTFRFYDVSREKEEIPSMLDMLRQIASIKNKTDREKHIATDYTVRLENLEDDGVNAVVGELVRCQGTNFPAELDGNNRKALTAKRLGHSVVFRLNHKTGIFGIQHDARVIGPMRILSYIAAFNPAAIYSMAPKINEDAWKKFGKGDTKKLAIRIANPGNLGALSDEGAAAGDAFRTMGEAYNAPSILVEISMGHHKGFISNAFGLAKQLTSSLTGGARLEKLSAVSYIDDERKEFDLIEDRILVRETLEIHDRDHESNWIIKRDFLSEEMKKAFG